MSKLLEDVKKLKLGDKPFEKLELEEFEITEVYGSADRILLELRGPEGYGGRRQRLVLAVIR